MKASDWMNNRNYINARSGNTVGLGSLLCVSLFIASCGGSKQTPPTTDTANDSDAIEKLLAEIIVKANAGDIEAVMSNFTEDAVAMPADEMPVFGKRLIRPRIQTLFDQSRLTIFLTSEETAVSGDFAFARGYIGGKIWPKSAAPDRLIDDNEYLTLLQKDSGGSWKIARLMWHPMFPKEPTVVE
jgi:ketosteroid isomerase-like protein